MQYISYKPWIGKNYRQQSAKILFIVHPFENRKLGIKLATYAQNPENSIIKYLEDFITHQFEDRALIQSSQVLAKQKIEYINRAELWANYACYLNSMYDAQAKDLTNEEQSGVNEAFYQVLADLKPDAIVVLGHAYFNNLPEPTILKHFLIEEMDFDYTLNGETFTLHIDKKEEIAKGYQVNGKIIYALRLVHDGVIEHISRRNNGFLSFSKELEICFETICVQSKDINQSCQPINLQHIIQTLQKKELVLLASHPKMGRTTFAVRLIEEMLSISNLPVVIFSLEYSIQTMAGKLVTSSLLNDFDKLVSGQLNEIVWRTDNKNSQHSQKIFIDDRRGLQPKQLVETCQMVISQYQGEIGLIVISDVQLLNIPTHTYMDSKAIILQELKTIAQQFNCPVLGLFNLPKASQLKWDTRPSLDDFKEKVAVNECVDTVIFLYQHKHYSDNILHKTQRGNMKISIAKSSQQVLGIGYFLYDIPNEL